MHDIPAIAAKPKILFLAQLPPPVHGAAMVSKSIVDSAVVRETFDLDVVDISTAGNVDDVGKVGIAKLLRTVALIARTVRKLLVGRYDLVYLTLSIRGPAFYKDALLALIAKQFGHKVVYHLHAKGMRDEARSSAHKRRLYRRVFAGADVILLSPLLRDDLEPVEGLCRVHYLPNGIESLGYEQAEKSHPPTILFLSNLLHSKGIQVLLEAAKLLARSNCDFQLVMAGSWGESAAARLEFEKQVGQSELRGKVQLAGPVQGDNKSRMLNRAAVFVLPTLDDCYPLVLLEAMSCCLPIVASKVGGIPEMVSESNGYVIQPNDPLRLADVLQALCKDAELRRRLGASSHEAFQARFSLHTFEAGLVRILKATNDCERVPHGQIAERTIEAALASSRETHSCTRRGRKQ